MLSALRCWKCLRSDTGVGSEWSYRHVGREFPWLHALSSHQKWLPSTSLLRRGSKGFFSGGQCPLSNVSAGTGFDMILECYAETHSNINLQHQQYSTVPKKIKKKHSNMYINLWSPLLITRARHKNRKYLSIQKQELETPFKLALPK